MALDVLINTTILENTTCFSTTSAVGTAKNFEALHIAFDNSVYPDSSDDMSADRAFPQKLCTNPGHCLRHLRTSNQSRFHHNEISFVLREIQNARRICP